MAQAKQGDTVKVHYTGKLTDGTVFDTSADREPLEFTLGEQRVIPGFESAVVGLEIGQQIETQIPVDQAYGPRRDDMVLEVGRDQLPEDLEPEIGQQLQVRQQDGQAAIVRIAAVSDASVTLDANHPLAGEDLVFDIHLVEIV